METLEHGAIARDVNGWTASGRSLLLRDLSSAFPRSALQDLRKRELVLAQAKLGADGVGNAISAEGESRLVFTSVKEWGENVQLNDGHCSPFDYCRVRRRESWDARLCVRVERFRKGAGFEG